MASPPVAWPPVTALPLLLTRATSLPPEVRSFFTTNPKGHSISRVYILGGTGVASESVVNELRALGKQVIRIAGATDRFDTAELIAKTFYTNPDQLLVANGYTMIDAMAGSVLSAQINAPVLLTATSFVPAATKRYSEDQAHTLESGLILGGTGVVPYTSERIIGENISQ